MDALALICVVALAAVHLVAGRLRFLDGIPRSRWLSLAGGIAIAYVFVHLLPELAEANEALAAGERLAFLERHAYLMALVGLVVFYGLEWAALRSRRRRRETAGDDRADADVLRLHTASFGAYNALVGYLVARSSDDGGEPVLPFAIAMAVHFVVADFGLRDHHREAYDRLVRWVLSAALIAGFVAGWLTELSEAAVGVLLAFLAGAIVLNTLTGEVPSERESRFTPFLLGAAGYAAVLLAI